ncbi:MAG TPA: dienelactone hydrolase family protein [Gemmatimonadaceae bacterium]|nr:dienelactone hydrolase family protein [Gemmatimonadaceae bacterium]
MRRHVLVLMVGVAACRPSDAAPIDDHDNPAVVAAVRAMAIGETAHLLTTDRRPASAADSLRADELVVAIRDAIGKYGTPDLAARDGYRELRDGDTATRAIVHVFNWRYAIEEAVRFNPAKPAALIYRRGRNGYRLLGATYMAPGASTEEVLDQRVPLSVAQWHQHVDLCVPKPDDTARWSEVGADGKAVFGPESAIDTQAGCDAVAGVFKPRVFGWMLEARVFVSDNPDSIWGTAPASRATVDSMVAVAQKPEAPKTEAPKAEPPKTVAAKPAGFEKGTVISDSVPISWERFEAVGKSHGPHPALILLHGAGGVPAEDSVLREAAKKLAAHGYVIEILQYFDRTKTIVADVGDQRADFGQWMRSLGDAITQLRTAPGVDSTKIGLVGINVGAALALHRAQVDKRVKAVVDYFGVYRVRDPANAGKLPPVLIVGGEASTFVPIAEARRLDAMLTKYNVPHETDVYPGSPNGLTPAESQQAAEHVIDFLRRYLPPG